MSVSRAPADRRGPRWVTLAVVLTAAVTACSTSAGPPADQSGAATSAAGEITVLAASSLTGAFTELGRAFETGHPGTTVHLAFAGSSDLAAQIRHGAPADVFASADTATMEALTGGNADAGAVPVSGSPRVFATNSLMIAVPPDNPAGISGFTDLARPGVDVVVCAPVVPCGAATERVERATGVTLAPVSEESAVADVANKVVTGEADAGVVYVTDVKAASGKVEGIAIPADDNAVNSYPIAVLARSGSAPARQFEAMVLGPRGQRVLAAHGFGPP